MKTSRIRSIGVAHLGFSNALMKRPWVLPILAAINSILVRGIYGKTPWALLFLIER